MAITTALALRTNYLNIPDGSQDAILTALISQAQSMMKSICMQPLEQTAIEETFTGTGTMYKSLSYTVPVTLSTLSYRLLPSDLWSSVAGGVIYTSDNLTRLYYGDGLTARFWKADLSVGWSSGSMPADLINICSEITLELFAATDFGGGENRMGLQQLSETAGGVVQTTVYRDLMTRYRRKLAPYILRVW